jgi:hypothetical protein
MGSLEQSIRSYFEQHEIRFIKAEGESDFRLDYTMQNFVAHCRVIYDEQRHFTGFSVSGGVKIPHTRRTDAMEYITRANHGLACGGFQMDCDDGDLLFRIGVFTASGPIATETMDSMVQIAIRTFDRYYNGLMEVVYANKAPSEAITEAEAGAPGQDQVDEVVEALLKHIADDGHAAGSDGEVDRPRKRRGRPRTRKAQPPTDKSSETPPEE